jgi:predicted metalloprotease with PDZ domain
MNFTAFALAASALSAPQPQFPVDTIPVAQDLTYPGTMTLKVDVTDIDHGRMRVQQTIPVAKPGPMTLLYPRWIPAAHAPMNQVEKLAGLTIRANGQVLAWKRDPVDLFAFHVDVPARARSLEVSFDYLSPTNGEQGRVVMTPDMINIEWEQVSLYPAGYFVRQISVIATAVYPAGWKAGTALRSETIAGNAVTYGKVAYDTLIDSPVFAGRNFRREDLGSGVALNIVADDPDELVTDEQKHIAPHRKLIEQAERLFGKRQFDRYDFLLSISDLLGGSGTEHHRSSENGLRRGYFTNWDERSTDRFLLPHELVHSWNGKFKRPADLWTPEYRTPMRSSLLWIYEGQTELWGIVLGARSGLTSKQDALDALALGAADLELRRGRSWRSLEDTTADPVMTLYKGKAWPSWQRERDYYTEGALLWLEVDGIIRSKTNGKRGLDDFARAFFTGREGDWGVQLYTFDDVVSALDAITPYDWRGFLAERTAGKASAPPLAGLAMGGYKLDFANEPTPAFKQMEQAGKVAIFSYSLGLIVSGDGVVLEVIWDSPAFKAGLAPGATLLAVNGRVFDPDVLKAVVKSAQGQTDPIRLTVKSGRVVRDVSVMWSGGLRYPRLRKIGKGDSSLDRLLSSR